MSQPPATAQTTARPDQATRQHPTPPGNDNVIRVSTYIDRLIEPNRPGLRPTMIKSFGSIYAGPAQHYAAHGNLNVKVGNPATVHLPILTFQTLYTHMFTNEPGLHVNAMLPFDTCMTRGSDETVTAFVPQLDLYGIAVADTVRHRETRDNLPARADGCIESSPTYPTLPHAPFGWKLPPHIWIPRRQLVGFGVTVAYKVYLKKARNGSQAFQEASEPQVHLKPRKPWLPCRSVDGGMTLQGTLVSWQLEMVQESIVTIMAMILSS
ncbi:hypothetical protein CONPUDRAFT_74796 [Coniophora puteana RWD-64-598 SS2]|uniref:Uncharacterized protein n=1 Tax=Coniophora puteana (strain RWD-64-598) TaxID=741705 RepID=A0A5M3MJP2_CONPW|nr:uncharacterized protein CONPUDRAFT_74796 [Coniophora puteana RWD-64-598 SS2]EIW79333.1 hypothetical protein CONPUDRAFT_74796 [Coniophora puteana RWD-64-598 SS2]